MNTCIYPNIQVFKENEPIFKFWNFSTLVSLAFRVQPFWGSADADVGLCKPAGQVPAASSTEGNLGRAPILSFRLHKARDQSDSAGDLIL